MKRPCQNNFPHNNGVQGHSNMHQDSILHIYKLCHIGVPSLMSLQHSLWDMQLANRSSETVLDLQCSSMGLSKGKAHSTLIVDISSYLCNMCIQPYLYACCGPLRAFMACFLKDISILLQIKCCMKSCQTGPMSSLKPTTKHHHKSE